MINRPIIIVTTAYRCNRFSSRAAVKYISFTPDALVLFPKSILDILTTRLLHRFNELLNDMGFSGIIQIKRSYMGGPVIKSVATFIFLSILLSSSVLAQDYPSIGLYFDESRTYNDLFGELYTIYNCYVFIHPGSEGIECVDFRLSTLPTSQYWFEPYFPSDIVDPIEGSIEEGITLCYTACQTDWTWGTRISFYYVDNTTESIIEVLPFPGSYEPKAITCPGNDIRVAILNYFGINTITPDYPPQIIDLEVLSPTSLEVRFDWTSRCGMFYEDVSRLSNFKTYVKDDTTHVIEAVRAEFKDDLTVSISYAERLDPGITYILEADGICRDISYPINCGTDTTDFSYTNLPDKPDLSVFEFSCTRTVRDACMPYIASYTLQNVGTVPTIPFGLRLSFYNMSNCQYTESICLDSALVGGLDPGESLSGEFQYDLSGLSAGRYYIGIYADPSDEIVELSDFNNKIVEEFYIYSPLITSISDKGFDYGGWVFLKFERAWPDQVFFEYPVAYYEILRRSPEPAACIYESSERPLVQSYSWEIVETVPATTSDTYLLSVPTLVDSTGLNEDFWTTFMVRAVRPVPDSTFYYTSCPDSGYSFSNYPVATLLQEFSADFIRTGIEIHWSVTAPDENISFRIYRSKECDADTEELSPAGIVSSDLDFRFVDSDIEPGGTYSYRIDVIDTDGQQMLFETDWVNVPTPPLSLYQNHPNPFNPSTTIEYYIPGTSNVTLEIYDVSGRIVKRLVNEEQDQGFKMVDWDGTNVMGNRVSSGIYFYRLTAGKECASRKMILLR